MSAATEFQRFGIIAVIAGACCFLGHMSSAVSAPVLGQAEIRPSMAGNPVPNQFIGEWRGGTSKTHNFVLSINSGNTCKMVYKSGKVKKGKVVTTGMYVMLIFKDGTRANLSNQAGVGLIQASFTMPDKSTKNYTLNRLQY